MRQEPEDKALDFVTRSRGRRLISAATARFLRHATLDPNHCAALYSVDPQGNVALRTLPPRTEHRLRDELLLLLYGMLTLRGKWPVVGGTLVGAARTSGIELERLPAHCERLVPGLLRDVES